MNFSLDKRLKAAYDMIQGGVLADIGTDHGKLPVAAVKGGKAEKAFACDINEGPLFFAKRLIESERMEDKITTLLSDGLKGLSLKEINFVSVLGMGGELIGSILESSKCEEYKGISFILNPMTRDEYLRFYLAENGFLIKKEVAVVQSGRVYTVINAVYIGAPYKKEPSWYYIGETDKTENGRRYTEKVLSRLKKQLSSPEKRKDTEKLIAEIQEKIK